MTFSLYPFCVKPTIQIKKNLKNKKEGGGILKHQVEVGTAVGITWVTKVLSQEYLLTPPFLIHLYGNTHL